LNRQGIPAGSVVNAIRKMFPEMDSNEVSRRQMMKLSRHGTYNKS
jgi:hypothetical protein